MLVWHVTEPSWMPSVDCSYIKILGNSHPDRDNRCEQNLIFHTSCDSQVVIQQSIGDETDFVPLGIEENWGIYWGIKVTPIMNPVQSFCLSIHCFQDSRLTVGKRHYLTFMILYIAAGIQLQGILKNQGRLLFYIFSHPISQDLIFSKNEYASSRVPPFVERFRYCTACLQ